MAPDPSLTPELVHARAFTVGFRGYDQSEVREFLNRVSGEIRSLREQIERLESLWRSAEERAARPPVLDEETLMAAVGEETAAILRTARASAAELRNKAAADADRVKLEAEGLLADKTKEAEEAADRIIDEARGEAARMMEKARAEADQIREKAEQDRALTIEGANSTRERILEDLGRRRRVATVQIEQLRAGRERLLESYAVVRRTLEEAQEELTRADAEARAAADEVGRRLNREAEPPAISLPTGTPPTGTPSPAAVAAGSGHAAGGEGPSDPNGPSDHHGSNGSNGSGGAAVATSAAADHPSAGATVEKEESEPAPHLRVVPDLGPEKGEPGDPETAAPDSDAQGIEPEPAATGQIAGEQGAGPRTADEGAEAQQPSADASPVDQLFAKIRSGRGGRSSAGRNGTHEQPDGADTPAEAPDEPAEASGPGSEAVPAAGDEAWLQKREQAISSLEVSLTRKLKRALQDEQNDLLDRLRGLRSEVTPAALLPPAASHKQRYSKAALPLVNQAASAGAEFAARALNGAAGKAPDVTSVADEAADAIVGPLRRRLEQAISVGASEDQAVLVETLGSAYREWKSQRVERIAGDALFAAFSSGTWHALPEGSPVRWIVDDLDGPCPDCDDDALAGGLPKGESFPTGQAHPPAHTGCRCLLVPVAAPVPVKE
jgi:DivIVA domain-containing protein